MNRSAHRAGILGGTRSYQTTAEEKRPQDVVRRRGILQLERLLDKEMLEIADAFVTARHQARPLAAFPGRLPQSLEDAYRIQDKAISLDGRRVVGWKVAMIRADLRAGLGADRLCGPIFEGTVYDCRARGNADVVVHAHGFAALEAEFVARFATDVLPGPDGFTKNGVAEAMSGLHAGVEVASSPLPTLNELGPTAVVSDQGNNAGAVIGLALSNWRDAPLADLTSEMLIDGVTVGRGSAASVPGGPLAALVFLADALKARGRKLSAGDIVLTGMTTGIHPVVPGSQGRTVFKESVCCDLAVRAIDPDRA